MEEHQDTFHSAYLSSRKEKETKKRYLARGKYILSCVSNKISSIDLFPFKKNIKIIEEGGRKSNTFEFMSKLGVLCIVLFVNIPQWTTQRTKDSRTSEYMHCI